MTMSLLVINGGAVEEPCLVRHFTKDGSVIFLICAAVRGYAFSAFAYGIRDIGKKRVLAIFDEV
jgi:hypothetical protein